jgi:uncharacterized membrane protein YkgB
MSANGIGGMIILAVGTTIVNKLGASNTVAVGLLLTSIKFITYSFLMYVRESFVVTNRLMLQLFTGTRG